ncbi:MAG: zinc-dependent dehydrogenase [Deltaproteobacteria bacterium]|nr:zinc-dependent dehydrogenase [Deltaproteobacteria bacterium]MBW2086678.1 zinc-dependent dehydrogenase [Deltaproteobacteria bacterium]
MRAAVYYSNKDIRLEERPTPSIGPGELLVKINASGICGTDVMEWYRIHKVPLVLGHEIAGEVVEVGQGVESFRVGDRVIATHHVPCFTCHHCLSGHETVCDTLLSGTHFDPGGFCEYVRLPAINVDRGTWKIPAGMSDDEATFAEPLACVLRGIRKAGLKPAQSVLVLGSGISGLLHVSLAKALGAGRIVATDISAYRLDAASRFGADHVLRADQDVPAHFREINRGLGADVVIVSTGAVSAMRQSMQAVERGGLILFFAPTMEGVTIPLSINDLFWRKDVTLTTSYAGSPADCAEALELIRAKRINVQDMITHHFGLADIVKGFQLVEKGDKSFKIIIRPQE